MAFVPVIIGGGVPGLQYINRTMDAQLERMQVFPEIQREEEYFRENIGNISTAEELVNDRRLLEVVLSRFGLQDEIDNRAFLQRVLEEGTTSETALANRLPDRRFREMSAALGFGDQEFSPLQFAKDDYSTFKSLVTQTLDDNTYWNSSRYQIEEASEIAEPLRAIKQITDRHLAEVNVLVAETASFLGESSPIVSSRESILRADAAIAIREEILADPEISAFLEQFIDVEGQYSAGGVRIGEEYDIITPRSFDQLSEGISEDLSEEERNNIAGAREDFAEDQIRSAWYYADGSFAGVSFESAPSETQRDQPIFRFTDLSGSVQLQTMETLKAEGQFSEEGALLAGSPEEQILTYTYDELEGEGKAAALDAALEDFFSPNVFTYDRLSTNIFTEKLIDTALASSPTERVLGNSRDHLASDQFNAFIDDTLAGFRRQQFEVSVGEQNESLRISLYAERKLPEIFSLDISDEGKWFNIMGDPPLRSMFETVFSLPSSFSQLDVDSQVDRLQDLAQERFGVESFDDFSDDDIMDDLVSRYAALSELAASSSTNTSSGSIAVSLLQGVAPA